MEFDCAEEIRLDTVLENCIFYISPMHEFSHSQVESRMGAVAWGLWPTPRFPSPLIKPDVPISGIRLSGWLHREARDGAARGRRWRHRTPRSRCMTSNVNRRLPRPCTLCLRARNLRTRSKTYWSMLRYALLREP